MINIHEDRINGRVGYCWENVFMKRSSESDISIHSEFSMNSSYLDFMGSSNRPEEIRF